MEQPSGNAAELNSLLLSVANVAYLYPGFRLGPLTLNVAGGEVLGVIGPNGCGKTTLLEVCIGRRAPASGEVFLSEGVRPSAAAGKRRVGYCPDETTSLFAELTAREWWSIRARGFGGRSGMAKMVDTAERIASELEFAPPSSQISSYSHGMRKKTQLIGALLHGPQLLVLDEPTNGLDPLSSYRFGTTMRSALSTNNACLVATHDLAWARRFCDRILVLRRGEITALGPVQLLDRSSDLMDSFIELTNLADDTVSNRPSDHV
jgi:ABC-2 type transport system ATP-binding protein